MKEFIPGTITPCLVPRGQESQAAEVMSPRRELTDVLPNEHVKLPFKSVVLTNEVSCPWTEMFLFSVVSIKTAS